MLRALAMIVVGAGLLAVAGDRLVDLAAALAERFGVSAAVIGLTVVAAGTSAPELVAASGQQRLEDTAANAVRNPLSLRLVYLDGRQAVLYG